MREETQELVNKFQQEHEVYLDFKDLETYWVITARVPKKAETLHHVHRARKYITTRNEGGSVLIIPHPEVSDSYFVESWGAMDSFEDFVEKTLDRIRADMNAIDNEEAERCGTRCS
ncbi:MAG: hypothetical protein WCX22_04440 [Methanoregula sp.]|jgi:hypothetical protein